MSVCDHAYCQSTPSGPIQMTDSTGIQDLNTLVATTTRYLDRAEFDSAEVCITEICRRGGTSTDPSLDYYCHTYKGLLLYYQGFLDEAYDEFSKALAAAEFMTLPKFRADAYSNMGMVVVDKGDFKAGIELNAKALTYRDESDQRGKSAAYTNLGIIYYQLGNMAQALSHFLLALEVDEKLGVKKDIAYSQNNLGLFYKYQGEYAKAIRYYQSANALCREENIKECIVGTLQNLGSIYKILGQYDLALQYFKDALQILEEKGYPSSMAEIAGNLSQIYTTLGAYALALEYLERAHPYNLENDLRPAVATDHANFGFLYTRLARYDKAREHYEQAIALNQELGLMENLCNNYLDFARLDSLSGDIHAAYAHFRLYAQCRDSLVHKSNQEKIMHLQHQYETEKKDKEILRLTNESQLHSLELQLKQETLNRLAADKLSLFHTHQLSLEKVNSLETHRRLQQAVIEKNEAHNLAQQATLDQNQQEMALLAKERELQELALHKQRTMKNLLLLGFVLLCLFSIFFYTYYVTRQQLRLQTLRNKIASDLHDDVGSTLSSISIFSEMAKQQSREVIPLLDTIGDSSRKMLDAMADIVWTINPENDQFENILLRMRSFAYQILGAKKIPFEFEAPDDLTAIKLPMDVRKNLYLIFKEAANNMAKYSQASKAHFSIREEGDELIMMIRDNGLGFDPGAKTDGNGLKNMRRRASEIAAQLTIQSRAGHGTTIQLRFAV